MQDQDICVHGLAVFEITCAKIVDGSVTVETLKHLNLHKNQVNKLCGVVCGRERKEDCLSSETVSKALDARLAEYDIFVEYFEKLQNVCSYLTGFGMS